MISSGKIDAVLLLDFPLHIQQDRGLSQGNSRNSVRSLSICSTGTPDDSETMRLISAIVWVASGTSFAMSNYSSLTFSGSLELVVEIDEAACSRFRCVHGNDQLAYGGKIRSGSASFNTVESLRPYARLTCQFGLRQPNRSATPHELPGQARPVQAACGRG